MERRTIEKIVKASGVEKGELILVHYWGEDNNLQLMHDFCTAVASAGAFPLPLQQARTKNRDIFGILQRGSIPEKYYSIFDQVDAVLDIFAYRPVVLNYDIGEEQMTTYRQHMSSIFKALSNKKRFAQIRIPTVENAEETDMAPEDFIQRMERAFDIDYDKLRIVCSNKIAEYEKASRITLHTGKDCSLTLVAEGREWIADCGDGDWPCGEVAIAPIEELSEGTVWFEKFWLSGVGIFQDVVLTVEKGQVITSNKEEINLFLSELPDNGRVVCELGFGCNENITDLCGYTILDEKMWDTFHIAIGDNTMFGGNNSARLHMDFVGTATVECHILF